MPAASRTNSFADAALAAAVPAPPLASPAAAGSHGMLLLPHTTNLVRLPGNVACHTRSLPSVYASSKGSVYEAPCLVILRVTLSGLLGLSALLDPGSAAAADLASPTLRSAAAATDDCASDGGSEGSGDEGGEEAAAAAGEGDTGKFVCLEVSICRAEGEFSLPDAETFAARPPLPVDTDLGACCCCRPARRLPTEASSTRQSCSCCKPMGRCSSMTPRCCLLTRGRCSRTTA